MTFREMCHTYDKLWDSSEYKFGMLVFKYWLTYYKSQKEFHDFLNKKYNIPRELILRIEGGAKLYTYDEIHARMNIEHEIGVNYADLHQPNTENNTPWDKLYKK